MAFTYIERPHFKKSKVTKSKSKSVPVSDK